MIQKAPWRIEAGMKQKLSACVGLLLFCLSQFGCSDKAKVASKDDPSIVFSEPFAGFKNYNGKAYDKASLCIEPNATLVIPDKATTVEKQGQGNLVVIYMEKEMSFAGDTVDHSIVDVRRKMGCAVKLEKGSLTIGSFGEYFFKEGAAQMKLHVLVPPNVHLIRQSGLIGEIDSQKRVGQRPNLTEKGKNSPECWLPPTAEDGWHAIPSVADPDHRASKCQNKRHPK
jgi:hypothetical protein